MTRPKSPLVYWGRSLAPSFILLFALQLFFAWLLQVAVGEDELSLGDAMYHTFITSSTVGLGDVFIETGTGLPNKWPELVVTCNILITVGFFAAILSDVGELAIQRKEQMRKLRMMVRQVDPEVINSLFLSYKQGLDDFAHSQHRSAEALRKEVRSCSPCLVGRETLGIDPSAAINAHRLPHPPGIWRCKQ